MEWHAVMTTFCICGWTTVVLSVLIHHGGVVWSWYEWSWLLIVVFSTIFLSNYFLVVAIGFGRDEDGMFDVCRNSGDMRRRRGRMDECLLMMVLFWCAAVVVTCGGGNVAVVEVGSCTRAIPSWWCMMMLLCRGWLLRLLIWCFCQLILIATISSGWEKNSEWIIFLWWQVNNMEHYRSPVAMVCLRS